MELRYKLMIFKSKFMLATRRKFSKEFKSKVVLETLKERVSLEVLAKKYELTPTQISTWKSQA